MIKSVFLDANILIDIYDDTRLYHEYSYKSVEYLINNEIEIYTSSDIITTVYYVLKKRSFDILEHIKQISIICNLIGFSNDELEEAIVLMEKNDGFEDLEDTIQYVLAMQGGCDIILSNDIDFPDLDIKIMTSKGFYKNIIKGN